MLDQIHREAAAIQSDLVSLRRDLHRVPEVGLVLSKTQQMLLAALEGLGLEIRTGKALSSIVATLHGGQPGPTVLLRGDMDALPILEATNLPFTSEHLGAMHACGHDLHMSMLVGAARVLSHHTAELKGNVIFMFQPGEESGEGAKLMIEEQLFAAAPSPVGAAYAIHVKSSSIPAGVFTTRAGTYMAAADELIVRVNGAGGHGSAPHDAMDPVVAMAEMITALQIIATRQFSIADPVVITTGTVSAGNRASIIPDTAEFASTLRSFSPRSRQELADSATRVVNGIAAAHGLSADVTLKNCFNATINSAENATLVAEVARAHFGDGRFVEASNPMPGAEDFSHILDQVPGAYMYLGATPEHIEKPADNHSSHAIFDDAVLSDGALMLSALALRSLHT